MTDDELLERFRRVRCFERGGERAPHKPLLLLLALARLQRGDMRPLAFNDVEDELSRLLVEFGPTRKTEAWYPFWHLASDGLWTLDERDALIARRNSTKARPPLAAARAVNPHGHLDDAIVARLRDDPSLANRAATVLLEHAFPRSLHDDILDAVGFPWTQSARAARDPEFRTRILRIYEYRCAVCGLDARLGAASLGLEAAHVKWHAAGGPDVDENGLALCVLHHRALDRGALGIDDEQRVLVSEEVHGAHGVNELLLRFAHAPLRAPIAGRARVERSYARWHRREVFRAPARGAG